jgi:ParB family chromosome partitioning protein
MLVIPVERFRHTPNNARKSMDPDELAALAENMKRNGQIQNVVAWLDEATNEYEIIGGNRRLAAATAAGIKTLVCMVVPREQKDEVRDEMAFAENMCRSDLKPTEVATHWKYLMDRWQCSTRELAARVGVAQSTVSKRMALLKLDPEAQQAVDAGTLHKTKAVQSVATPRKKEKGKGRGPYGVHELTNGTVKLKRGCSLAALAAELVALAHKAA